MRELFRCKKHSHDPVKKEWIAASRLMKRGHELFIRRQTCLVLEVVSDLGFVQAAQRELMTLAHKLTDNRTNRGRAIDRTFAKRPDDGNAGDAQSARYKFEHLERRVIGIVQVVEDKEQR